MICSILMASFLADFLTLRLELRLADFFVEETLDWWLISTTPNEIYLSCKLQLLLFLGKATMAYAYGQPFFCIKAEYVIPGRQVLVEQVVDHSVRQFSSVFTPSSCQCSPSTSLAAFNSARLDSFPDIEDDCNTSVNIQEECIATSQVRNHPKLDAMSNSMTVQGPETAGDLQECDVLDDATEAPAAKVPWSAVQVI